MGNAYNLNSYGGLQVTLPTSNAFTVFNGSTYPFVVDKNGNATAQNLTANGTTSLQALTATSMTLNNVTMPTPAYLRAYLTSSGVAASSTVSLSWMVGSNSVINMPSAPTYKIVCPDIGVYLFAGKINCGTAITSIKVLALKTSTDNGVNYTIVAQWQNGSAPAGMDFVFGTYLHVPTVSNQIFQVTFNNDLTTTFPLNNVSILSSVSLENCVI